MFIFENTGLKTETLIILLHSIPFPRLGLVVFVHLNLFTGHPTFSAQHSVSQRWAGSAQGSTKRTKS